MVKQIRMKSLKIDSRLLDAVNNYWTDKTRVAKVAKEILKEKGYTKTNN